jgi:hypothetical protein
MTRCWCTSSHLSESNPAWNGITRDLHHPKKLKTGLPPGKIMASVFLYPEGVIHVDFLPHGVTINVQYYSNLIHNEVHQVIQEKRPGKLSKNIIILHDNTRPCTANLTKATLATVG